jgi:hypothetical protein
MLANARDARRRTMLKSDLHPPRAGPSADPVLYGVAAGLATLFPPVTRNGRSPAETGGAFGTGTAPERRGSE